MPTSDAKRPRPDVPAGPSDSLGEAALARLSVALRMLGEPSRLRIVLALLQAGELNVSALCKVLRKSQPAVSHHLMLLREGGLVQFRRTGKNNFYRLDDAGPGDLFAELFHWLSDGKPRLQLGGFILQRKKSS